MTELPQIHFNSTTAISKRWIQLQQKVNGASIVASSRGLMVDPVLDACEAGVQHFSEDYLPEGITKKPVIQHRFPSTIWHFAGTLQSDKLSLIVEFFDWIDGFDRPTLLKPLSEACRLHPTKKVNVLLEINPIGHHKKIGLKPGEVPDLAAELAKIPQIIVKGLSCRSDLMMSPDLALRAYTEAANIHKRLLVDGSIPASATELAMGSSRDFEKAIELGATMVRIGSALFGKSAASTAIAGDFN